MIKAIILEKLLRMAHKSYRVRCNNWEKASKATQSGGIFLGWHCFIWVLAYFFARKHKKVGDRFITLASLSEDGQLITDVLNRLGWKVIRGSSSRGAIKSLRLLLQELENERRVVITPDGPKGPARKVKPGSVLLQRRSNLPVVPVGIAIDWKYTFSSWDEFQLPYPGSKISLYFGDTVDDLAGLEKEEACELLETKMEDARKRASEMLA